jgi:hypothetical protein
MVASVMTTKKPPRVYVQILNPHTGSSRTVTLYGVDEVQAAEQIRRMVEKGAGVGGVQAPAADGAGETTPTVR